MRVGFGYDVHKLEIGHSFILGGIEVEFHKGLVGHSDGDVLVHAIIDALLGAAGMGDIGRHFPDTDEKYKGISSLELLKDVVDKIASEDYKIVNIDSTIVCETPKLKDYIPVMEKTIAQVFGLAGPGQLEKNSGIINIKATTTEGLGFTGTGEGVAANAVCLIEKVL